MEGARSNATGMPIPLPQFPPEVVSLYRQNVHAAGEMARHAAFRQGFPCKPNCSWCCHRAVPITEVDLAVVVEAVKHLDAGKLVKVHENLERWRAATAQIPGWPQKYEAAQVLIREGKGEIGLLQIAPLLPAAPCPFLTEDRVVRVGGQDAPVGPGVNAHSPSGFAGRGACMIYNDRPLECRLHAAKDDQGRAHGCRGIVAGVPTRLATLDARGARSKFAESGAVPVGFLPMELDGALKLVAG